MATVMVAAPIATRGQLKDAGRAHRGAGHAGPVQSEVPHWANQVKSLPHGHPRLSPRAADLSISIVRCTDVPRPSWRRTVRENKANNRPPFSSSSSSRDNIDNYS